MRKQAGVTLLEMVIALGIMSAIVVGTSALIDRYSEDTRGAVAAQHLHTVGDAAKAYIKDNYTTVLANATATQPAIIRVSDLIAGGYLQTGYSTANVYQQNVCVLVLEPTANNLAGLVVAEGGTAMDDLTLGGIAGNIGASGGGVYSTATTTVRGAMGGWSMAVGNFTNANNLGQHCDGTAGVVAIAAGHPAMALWFEGGDSTSGFLYRDSVPGRPELNQMNTPIVMGAGTVQTVGNACTTNGAIGRDANGGVVSCVSSVWKAAGGSQYWQDPVANFASLPACNAAALNQTRVVQTPTVGSGPRAYTCDGASWRAVALDNNGRLYAGGYAAGSANINSYSMEIGGPNPTTTNNEGKLYLHHHGIIGHQLRYNNGTLSLEAAGNGYGTNNNPNFSTGTAQVNTVVTENTACSPNGLVARDSVGLLLSCQSGIWKKASGGGTGMSGILAPLKSMTISCCGGYSGGCSYAMVDASGQPFSRTVNGPKDSGWVAGFASSADYSFITNKISTWNFGANPSLIVKEYYYWNGSTADVCTANWPAT